MRFGDAERAINLDDVLTFVDHFTHYFLAKHALEHAMILLHHFHEVGVVWFIALAFWAFACVFLVHHVHLRRSWILQDYWCLCDQIVTKVFIWFYITEAGAWINAFHNGFLVYDRRHFRSLSTWYYSFLYLTINHETAESALMAICMSMTVKLTDSGLIIIGDYTTWSYSTWSYSTWHDAWAQTFWFNFNFTIGIYLHIDQSKRRCVAWQLLYIFAFVAASLSCFLCSKVRCSRCQANRWAGWGLSCWKERCIERLEGWQFRFLAFLNWSSPSSRHLKRVKATVFLPDVGRLVFRRDHNALKVVFSLLFKLLLEHSKIFL